MADRLLEHALDGDATTTEWREAGFRAASEAGAFFAVTAGSRMAQAALGITTRAPPVAALATLATVALAPSPRVRRRRPVPVRAADHRRCAAGGRVRRDGLRYPGRPADVAGTVPPGVGRRLRPSEGVPGGVAQLRHRRATQATGVFRKTLRLPHLRRQVFCTMDRGPPAAPEDRRAAGRALVEALAVPRRADGAALLPAVRALLAEAERRRARVI